MYIYIYISYLSLLYLYLSISKILDAYFYLRLKMGKPFPHTLFAPGKTIFVVLEAAPAGANPIPMLVTPPILWPQIICRSLTKPWFLSVNIFWVVYNRC